ncbi:type II secretion system protein [Eubacterium aggregans]|uniref:type II secretion system protein n=1 Tax=Eubacterium aggregans TaxID=81409 RepID=UPI003F2FFE94
MRTHLRKLMEKNDGMTLVEVIVAFAILTIAMVILLYGMTMAIKVMGNAESIKNAEENNASSLDLEKELTD